MEQTGKSQRRVRWEAKWGSCWRREGAWLREPLTKGGWTDASPKEQRGRWLLAKFQRTSRTLVKCTPTQKVGGDQALRGPSGPAGPCL